MNTYAESTSSKVKYYAGIGSRKTPEGVLKFMKKVGERLAERGWILRSGGAWGADQAFETGCDAWYHFTSGFDQSNNGKPIPKEIFHSYDVKDDQASVKALELAAKCHPAWNRVRTQYRKLHARNAFQVLGRDLKTPVQIVLCWTPDGCTSSTERSIITGGTGTAISIASVYGIKVLNFFWKEHREKVARKLGIEL